MGCEDPDGRIVRLYVEDDKHEWINRIGMSFGWVVLKVILI